MPPGCNVRRRAPKPEVFPARSKALFVPSQGKCTTSRELHARLRGPKTPNLAAPTKLAFGPTWTGSHGCLAENLHRRLARQPRWRVSEHRPPATGCESGKTPCAPPATSPNEESSGGCGRSRGCRRRVELPAKPWSSVVVGLTAARTPFVLLPFRLCGRGLLRRPAEADELCQLVGGELPLERTLDGRCMASCPKGGSREAPVAQPPRHVPRIEDRRQLPLRRRRTPTVVAPQPPRHVPRIEDRRQLPLRRRRTPTSDADGWVRG